MSDAYGSGGTTIPIALPTTSCSCGRSPLIRRYRVYHGKGDAPTVTDALEINRDMGTAKRAAPSR